MRYVVMTVARQGTHYIYDTIDSFSHDDPITFVVGGPDHTYLDRYKPPRFTVVGADDYSHLDRLELYERAVWNYWRCLGEGDGREDLLVMEDDIKFSVGWQEYLKYCLGRVRARHKEFVLTLYVPNVSESGNVKFTFPLDAYRKGEAFAYYDMSRFYGNQAVVYSPGVQRPFTAFLKHAVDGELKLPTDYLLRKYCIDNKVPILATAPCLVQHMGIKTTGLQGRPHQSACFLEAVCVPRGRTVAVVTRTWNLTSDEATGTAPAKARVLPVLPRRIPRR